MPSPAYLGPPMLDVFKHVKWAMVTRTMWPLSIISLLWPSQTWWQTSKPKTILPWQFTSLSNKPASPQLAIKLWFCSTLLNKVSSDPWPALFSTLRASLHSPILSHKCIIHLEAITWAIGPLFIENSFFIVLSLIIGLHIATWINKEDLHCFGGNFLLLWKK